MLASQEISMAKKRTTFGARLALATLAVGLTLAQAEDQAQWGQRHTRNMVSGETGLPTTFDPKTGQNVKWSAKLGTRTYSTPVVAGGKVLIGTNNGEPRDPRHRGDRGVLMCLDEKDGAFLWQLVVPKKTEDEGYADWPEVGIVSPPTIDGERIYLVNNRNEVMCLDLDGQADGNQGPFLDEGRHMARRGDAPMNVTPSDADILWVFDMGGELGVRAHDAPHCSILALGRYLYICTSNGVDAQHRRMVAPEAPSLIVLDKETGRLVAHDAEPIGPKIAHCTWSSPSTASVGGKDLVFFAGGDGICYAFEAVSQTRKTVAPVELKKVWRFDCDPEGPKENVHQYKGNRTTSPVNIYGMPVFHRNRIYVAVGGDFWHGKTEAWLKCIDSSGSGDITAGGELWSHPLTRHCMATPAVHDGLVFIGDTRGKLHCLEAETGRPHWTHQSSGTIWGSPLVADGKVYQGNQSGDLMVLAAHKDKKILGEVALKGPINGSPIAANGVLYIATWTHLYAVEAGGGESSQ
jgi:outer membrane protein assembly factor BamB